MQYQRLGDPPSADEVKLLIEWIIELEQHINHILFVCSVSSGLVLEYKLRQVRDDLLEIRKDLQLVYRTMEGEIGEN